MENELGKDNFAHKSKSWDMNSRRVQNAKSIAESIIEDIELDKSMVVMDFGVGTGLLSYFIAPYIKKVVAVDNSPSMLEVLREKQSEFDCEVDVINIDLSVDSIDIKLDGIISSMTIHHLEDTEKSFQKLYSMLKDGGFISIADLYSEDGTFHSDNIGVYHFGLDEDNLKKIAKDVGFKNITFKRVSIISKPHRDFELFLMSAFKI